MCNFIHLSYLCSIEMPYINTIAAQVGSYPSFEMQECYVSDLMSMATVASYWPEGALSIWSWSAMIVKI